MESCYLKYSIIANGEWAEIYMAELAELGFDSFEELENELLAYCPATLFKQELFDEFLNKYNISSSMYTKEEVRWQNWNSLWESNYEPVVISDQVYIHAHFHPANTKYPYSILITPKMSFGTGHHSTTSLMVETMLELDFKGKKVLDAGTGTGILAIFAEKIGASSVFAYDIDEWPVENTIENIGLNSCHKITTKRGVITDFGFVDEFDFVLANINRNILENEIPYYSRSMKKGGYLLLSGFYTEDIPHLTDISKNHYLSSVKSNSKNNWAVIVLQKTD